jgi:uncharacterized membrane protein
MTSQNLGPEEAAKLEAIERLVASLREDAGKPLESLADRAADRVAGIVGSWKFLLTLVTGLVCYMGFNIWLSRAMVVEGGAFDPYPFILLNLCLSFQAAFTAPIILMATNRAASKDRRADRKAHRTIFHIEELVKILAAFEGAKTMDHLCEACSETDQQREGLEPQSPEDPS